MVVVTALGAGVARADDRAAADALVVEGNKLGRAGELDAALAKFKEAFHLVPRAFYACNIGLAYARKEEWARAHYYLALCRSRWDTDEKRPLESWVSQRVDEAVAKLQAGAYAPVRVEVQPAGATIQVSAFSADEPVTAGALFWLPFGHHRLTVTMAGYREKVVEVELSDRSEKSVAVTLEAIREDAVDPVVSREAAVPAQPSRGRRSSAVPWIVAGAGGALLVAGGVSHVIALGTKSDAEELPPGDAFEDKRSAFRTQRKVAIALYGAGAITAGIGLFLALRGGGEDDAAAAPPVSVTTDGSAGMVTFQRSW